MARTTLTPHEIETALEIIREALEDGNITIDDLDYMLGTRGERYESSIQGFIDEIKEETATDLKAWGELSR